MCSEVPPMERLSKRSSSMARGSYLRMRGPERELSKHVSTILKAGNNRKKAIFCPI
jgi:hypothetical protein